MKTISTKTDLPANPHLAVLSFGQRYVEGDERSRNAPGHGYPAHYEPTTSYIAFDSQDELSRWIERNAGQSFAVIHSSPKTVETRLHVSLT